jgi:hypothetical protein
MEEMNMSEIRSRSFRGSGLRILTRSKGGDGRTVSGLAVPYKVPMEITPGRVEMFRKGAFDAQLRGGAADRIPLKSKVRTDKPVPRGGEALGQVTLLRDDDAGLYGEFRVSQTQFGDDTLELIRDGVLTDLAIVFREVRNTKNRSGIIEWTSAELLEVVVELEGTYGPSITNVRMDRPTPNRDSAKYYIDRLPQLRED